MTTAKDTTKSWGPEFEANQAALRVAYEAQERIRDAGPDMLQALREVEGDCYYLPNPGDVPRCGFCQQDEGEPHEPECTMNFVLAAIAKAEGR